MSRLAAEMGKGVASSGEVLAGDSSLPRQAEISVGHRAKFSNDELVKIINESKASLDKGIPVLIVPSSDRRLAAVAVSGLEISVQKKGGSGKKGQKDLLAWLLLLSSLAATITYTAGLSPPGGVWGADDKANGYVAGNPVMRDKAPRRYLVFRYSNTTAFFASLMLIGMLNGPITSKTQKSVFSILVALGLLSLATAFTAGTSTNINSSVYTATMLGSFLLYMFVYHGLPTIVSIHGKQEDHSRTNDE